MFVCFLSYSFLSRHRNRPLNVVVDNSRAKVHLQEEFGGACVPLEARCGERERLLLKFSVIHDEDFPEICPIILSIFWTKYHQ